MKYTINMIASPIFSDGIVTTWLIISKVRPRNVRHMVGLTGLSGDSGDPTKLHKAT